MTYEVLLTQRAKQQLEEAARWWAEHRSSDEAERWYDGFLETLLSLRTNPDRCSPARENPTFAYEIRQLAFGLGRRFTHRAVFTIRENEVVVLAIRHLAQDDIAPDDVD